MCYRLTTSTWILFISAYIRRCCTRLRTCLFFLVLPHFSRIASSDSTAVIFLGVDLQLHEQPVGMSWMRTEIGPSGRKISGSLHSLQRAIRTSDTMRRAGNCKAEPSTLFRWKSGLSSRTWTHIWNGDHGSTLLAPPYAPFRSVVKVVRGFVGSHKSGERWQKCVMQVWAVQVSIRNIVSCLDDGCEFMLIQLWHFSVCSDKLMLWSSDLCATRTP